MLCLMAYCIIHSIVTIMTQYKSWSPSLRTSLKSNEDTFSFPKNSIVEPLIMNSPNSENLSIMNLFPCTSWFYHYIQIYLSIKKTYE